MEIFKTKNAQETKKLGLALAQSLMGNSGQLTTLLYSNVVPKSSALVLELCGELGSGKTTFVKGLARGLGIKAKITSPTYVFARSYKFSPFKINGQVKNKFYHLDLYRLDDANDAVVLNSIEFQEIINDPSAVVAIEWAERLSTKIKSVQIHFDYDDSGRSIRID